IVDTIGWDVRQAGSTARLDEIPVRGKRYFRVLPPSAEPATVLVTDGHIVVQRPLATEDGAATFSVTRITFSGDTVYDRMFAYTPVEYSTAALDIFAARAAKLQVRTYPSGRRGFQPVPEGPDS